MSIFISESETGSGPSANIDSACANLAGILVNAFVDAGFSNDQLMVAAEEGNSWVCKNKDHGDFLTSSFERLSIDDSLKGMMSAAAKSRTRTPLGYRHVKMDQSTSLSSSFPITHPQLLNHISGQCIPCHRSESSWSFSRQAQILVEVCSFVATGNGLRVQKLLQLCGKHLMP
jgi:hypothetical protein